MQPDHDYAYVRARVRGVGLPFELTAIESVLETVVSSNLATVKTISRSVRRILTKAREHISGEALHKILCAKKGMCVPLWPHTYVFMLACVRIKRVFVVLGA